MRILSDGSHCASLNHVECPLAIISGTKPVPQFPSPLSNHRDHADMTTVPHVQPSMFSSGVPSLPAKQRPQVPEIPAGHSSWSLLARLKTLTTSPARPSLHHCLPKFASILQSGHSAPCLDCRPRADQLLDTAYGQFRLSVDAGCAPCRRMRCAGCQVGRFGADWNRCFGGRWWGGNMGRAFEMRRCRLRGQRMYSFVDFQRLRQRRL